MPEIENPLTETPEEVPLPHAPLVRVIGQVRFPPVLSLEKRDFVAPFQEAIREAYPVLRPEQAQGVLLGPEGMAPGPRQIAWRFSDTRNEWRVSLTPDFVALETTAYRSRGDFMNRLEAVLVAVAEHVRPALLQRLGLRYVDRITGEALADIGRLVRPEVLGVLRAPFSGQLGLSLTQSVFDMPESGEKILARWGLVPAGATVDPTAIEPINERSWVLDIDMFSTQERDFAPDEIVSSARRYSERLYAVFRWAVTDNFLRRFGGTP